MMDTVESQRVLSVVDEAVESLRVISYITPEVIAASDQLGGVLGQDVQDVLQQHGAVLDQLPADFQPHQVVSTASNLLRMLKKASIEGALASLHTSRSPAMLQLLSYVERHRALVVKRLHTTVEEDASTKGRLTGLSGKLEAAAAERLQLEHRLKLQRLEQAKASGTLQAAYDTAAAALAELRSGAASRQAADKAAAAAAKQQADEVFRQQHADLSKQLEGRMKELAAARADGSDATAAASKTRRRALQDCEVAIGEYDTEMGARQAEYDAALAAHTELLANIQRVTTEAGQLRAQRIAYEEAQRAAAEAARRAELAALRREAAAYMIQNRWKVYRKAKAAAAKAAAKGGKGGKGSKAGAAAAGAASKKKK